MRGVVWCLLTLVPIAVRSYPTCPQQCFCPRNFTDCKYNSLTSLPDGLDPNVTVLDLSYNEFQVFPEDINYYTNLRSLNLSHNKIQSLGVGTFGQLRNLELLDLTYNMFSDWMDIRSNIFTSTKKLYFLDFSHNPLRSLPGEKNPLQIVSLRILRLNNCSIENLNNKILEKLPNLTELHLAGNPIRSLRTSFVSHSLKFIDLSRCQLQHISPLAFTNLTALETMYMYKNTNLTKFFCNSESLRYLDLSLCNLRVVPSGNLPQVYEANFHGNNFQRIPNYSFINYTNLQALVLSYNAIDDIQESAFVGLSKVERIDLSQNRLREIDRTLFETTENLKFLNLSRNYISKVPSLISDSLKALDLSSCEIHAVDRDCLSLMPNLKILNLSKNIISRLPDYLQGDSLNTLDVSLCRIENVNNKTFAALISLRNLYLFGNRLTSVSPESFLQVSQLDISDNLWACDCAKLKELYTWLTKTGKRIENLYCQTPDVYEGQPWSVACQKEWTPEANRSDSVWWYTTGLIITVFLILFVILGMRRMYLLKEKRIRQTNEARRIEERESLRRMQRMQAEVREEASRNAPDPRELQTPPSYNEALLMPRLDASHPSLAGSLHSIASKHSLHGSLPDVAKRSRPRRHRRRRKSDSSEGQRACRVVVDSDSSDSERPQPRTTLESDF
ncbi:leucine-rich repeat protein SHOC-2 [Tenebrio molitor]|jgi:insulin-like growth factor-binding protein complex acid labile subunit|uniref:leucine-rich repeat protein SHOC-2 n=1 Tax=Tenebrio molitor TaxID=7067 RepID=UPI00362491A7